jgi:hypothetical protein
MIDYFNGYSLGIDEIETEFNSMKLVKMKKILGESTGT